MKTASTRLRGAVIVLPQCYASVVIAKADDGEMLLVLEKNGAVVHIEQHSRENGDFTPVPALQPLTAQTESFAVAIGEQGQGNGHGSGWCKASPSMLRCNQSVQLRSVPRCAS